jgi:hypothetical protein
MDLRIPKRIIQTGKSRDLPLFSKAAVANIKLLNPDFEYLFFDDNQVKDFVYQHFPEYRSVFDSFRYPISRYDFFRYLAVYYLGGFYFDLDVFLAFNLADLLEYECVFAFEELTNYKFLRRQYGMDWEIGNFAFGAEAGHPFMDAIIKNCVRAQRDPNWVQEMLRPIPRIFREDFYVLCASAPGLVSRTLAEYPDASQQVKVLFPKNVCDHSKWFCFGEYGIHLMQGTWLKRKRFLKRRLFAIWISRTRKKLLKDSLKLGESRSLEFKKKA